MPLKYPLFWYIRVLIHRFFGKLFPPVVPVILNVAPNHGPAAGGTSIIIKGSGFKSIAIGATLVEFLHAGSDHTLISHVDSDTQITATTPAELAGRIYGIRITRAFGPSSANSSVFFTYNPEPTITSVTPDQGRQGGGTAITIAGSGFTGATVVRIYSTGPSPGPTNVDNLVIVSDTQITCTTQAWDGFGSRDSFLKVVSPDGTAVLADAFHYDGSAVVTSIDKRYSDTGGGRTRRILGSGFTGATSADVLFGATAATSIRGVDDNTIDAVVPAHAAGLVGVSVFGTRLKNAIRFWDPSVPGTPTFCVDRGGFSTFTYKGDPDSKHWVRRFGSFNPGGAPLELRLDTNIGGRPAVDVEGEPYFHLSPTGDSTISGTLVARPTNSDVLNVSIEDLFGGANPNLGGTLLFVGNIREIHEAPAALLYAGDALYYDNGQNRNALLLDTTPQVAWMWWDGSFKRVATPIGTSGRFAVAVVRDVTTNPVKPFMKITTDGATWAGSAGSTPVGSVTSSQQAIFGTGLGGSFRGLGRAMAWYKIQLTAQDITNFYGWYDAEFPHEAFPASSDPRGWWGGSGSGYAGVPWLPTASEGMSGGGLELTTLSGAAPGVGTAVDGFTPATLDGTTQGLRAVAHSRHLIGDSANAAGNGPFTIILLAKATGSQASAASWRNEPGLVTDNDGWIGISFTTTGIRASVNPVSTPRIPQAVGSWFMATIRYDAAHVDLRVNRTDATPAAVTTHDTINNVMRLGSNYDGTYKFQGEIMQSVFFNRRLSDAELAAWYAHYQTKYPSMALP